MFHYYLAVLKKYAIFKGRARRAEYWYFVLVNFLIQIAYRIALSFALWQIVTGIQEGSADASTGSWIYPLSNLYTIYVLAVFIPGIAVSVRRMHDVNKSGWFMLIPIYNFILAVTDGTKGDNKYGPDPKARTDEDNSKKLTSR